MSAPNRIAVLIREKPFLAAQDILEGSWIAEKNLLALSRISPWGELVARPCYHAPATQGKEEGFES